MGVKIKATGDPKLSDSHDYYPVLELRLLDKEAVTITIFSGISPPNMEDKKMPLHLEIFFSFD